ncbi:MAG: hypothetical protein K6F92_04365 [Lachnospiraceae bacterium]|nr:hypothetical protein [Lachnospiraceae bacterium]
MIKRHSILLGALHNYLLFVTTAYFCLTSLDRDNYAPMAAVMVFGLYFAISQLLFEGIGRLWKYLIMQAVLIPVVGYFAIGYELGVPFILLMLIQVFMQVMHRLRGNVALLYPVWQVLVYYLVTYLLALFMDNNPYKTFVIYMSMAYIILVILDLNNLGLVAFLNVRKNVKSLPYEQIKRSNALMLGSLFGVVGILFLLSGFFLNDGPIYYVVNLLKSFLKWLFSRIHFESAPVGEMAEPVSADDPMDNSLINQDYVKPERGPFSDTALYIMSAIAITVITIGLIVFVVRLVNRILRARAEKQECTEADDYAMDEVVMLERPKREKFSFKPKTVNEQIRLRYRKDIFKKRRENKLYDGVGPHLTPSQIEEESVYLYGDNKPENEGYWQVLHSLYEKARYSRQECTQDDASLLKKAGR